MNDSLLLNGEYFTAGWNKRMRMKMRRSWRRGPPPPLPPPPYPPPTQSSGIIFPLFSHENEKKTPKRKKDKSLQTQPVKDPLRWIYIPSPRLLPLIEVNTKENRVLSSNSNRNTYRQKIERRPPIGRNICNFRKWSR